MKEGGRISIGGSSVNIKRIRGIARGGSGGEMSVGEGRRGKGEVSAGRRGGERRSGG